MCLNPFSVYMEQQCLLHVIDISSLKSPTMHVGVSFSFETMFNSLSVNLRIGVDGGLYTDTVCSFVGSEIFTASISQSQFSTISSGMNFWLTTECRSRAYAILICLSSSSSSLLLSSVSTPPDHMLGQIKFILCMHMQLYPI